MGMFLYFGVLYPIAGLAGWEIGKAITDAAWVRLICLVFLSAGWDFGVPTLLRLNGFN